MGKPSNMTEITVYQHVNDIILMPLETSDEPAIWRDPALQLPFPVGLKFVC